MDNPPTPKDLEIMAIEAGITVVEACRRARVTPAVFHRWKRGSDPGIENIRAIMRELRAATTIPTPERNA